MTVRFRQAIFLWLPVLLWAGMIFSASTDLGSMQHTSRIIGPVLHWLFPDISDEAVHWVQLGVRKASHATEYAIFAILIWRALRPSAAAATRPWAPRRAWQAWLLATGYAVTDEFHQWFNPNREASVRDVLIDSAGAALGVLLVHLWGRFRRWW